MPDETYGEQYYRTANYVDYLDRGPRYEKMARELDDFFFKAKIREPKEPLLDFGCATGHLVRGFQEQGYICVTGYDISRWAVKHGNSLPSDDPLLNLTNDVAILERAFHMVTAFDVFEHIRLPELIGILGTLDSRYLVLRVPVLENGSDDYPLEAHRRDPTHVLRMRRNEWNATLEGAGWTMVCRLNLHSVWDSCGVFAAVYRHKGRTIFND